MHGFSIHRRVNLMKMSITDQALNAKVNKQTNLPTLAIEQHTGSGINFIFFFGVFRISF